MSACGNIGSDPKDWNLEVDRTQWLETELHQLDNQHVQLLAFYNMRYGGKVLPESWYVSA